MQVPLFTKLLGVVLAGALWSPVFIAQALETRDSLPLTLDKTVQFPDLEGEKVLIPAGDYSVKAGEEQFILIDNNSKAITIEANEDSHSIDILSPTLVFLSGDEDDATKVHALVLYYPDGKTLQALGNDPEVISRGTFEPTAEDLEFIDPALVTFDQPVHFFSPEGNPSLVEPGTYTAESAPSGIRLIPDQGQAPLLIEAEHGAQDSGIPDLLALSLPGETPEELDLHYVMLLLPTGESLEAVGTYSGIQDRGFWNKKRKSKRAKKRRPLLFKKVGSAFKKAKKSPAFKKASQVAKQTGQKGWSGSKWALGQAGKGISKGANATWKGTKWVGKQIGKGGLIAAKGICIGGLKAAQFTAKGSAKLFGPAKKALANLLQVDKAQKAMRKAIDRIKERNGEAIRRTIEATLIMTDPKNSKIAKDLISPNKMCDRPGKTIQRTFQKMVGGPVRRALAVVNTGKDSQVQSRGSFASASIALGGNAAKIGGGEGGVRFAFDFVNKPHLFIDIAALVKTNVGAGGGVEIGIFPRKNPVDTGGWFLGAGFGFPCKVFAPKLPKEVGCNLDFFFDFPLRFDGSVFKPQWDLTSWGFFLDHFQGFAAGVGGGKSVSPVEGAIKIGVGIRVTKK